jgi:hypothetical protein
MMNRREALAALAAAIAARAPILTAQAAPAPAREQGKHLLDRFEVFRVRVNQRGDWVLLRTRTSSGLSGLGDCSHSGDDLKVLALLNQYERELRERSIFSVEDLRQWSRPEIAMHGRPAVVAVSAIEQSLWDLQGQAMGVPTYELFGGKLRPGIRQYANVNRMTTDRTPAGFARSVEQAVVDKSLWQRAARIGEWKYLKIFDNTFLFNVVADPLERANLKERRPDIYHRLVVEWTAWNATMLPETAPSYTENFTGAEMADHLGMKAVPLDPDPDLR